MIEEAIYNSPQTEEIACPVCDEPCLAPPLYRYTATQAATHFCPASRDPDRHQRLKEIINRLWSDEDCAIYRCAECGFGFGVPFVGGDAEFYMILHEQRGYPIWRWDYEVAITHALLKFNGGRILDIGAGNGRFLRTLDPIWERYAVETSDVNRSDLEKAGVRVFPDLSVAAEQEAGTFQIVTLFQVLEHIATFNQTIESCRDLLSPGGHLVITVPDCDAMIRQQSLTGCHDMPPNHINKWTVKSLALALSKAGFVVKQAIDEPPSLLNLKSSLHMKVMADAAIPNSLAAQAYRLKNKSVRIAALACLGLPALATMLPHARQLSAGGAFAVVACTEEISPWSTNSRQE